MNDLHKAFNVMGLEPGSSEEAVRTRFKRLMMVWHPDRFSTDEQKKFANDELIKIKDADDLLVKHFRDGSHVSSNCACQSDGSHASSSSQKSSATGPGPGRRTKNEDDIKREDEAARKRDAERRNGGSDTAQKANEEAQNSAREQAVQSAVAQENDRKSESLRWKLAIAGGAYFLILLILPMIGRAVEKPLIGAEDAVLNLQGESESHKKMNDAWQQYTTERQRIASDSLQRDVSVSEAQGWHPPYVSTDQYAGTIAFAMAQKEREQTAAKQQQDQAHARDVTNTQNEISKAQGIIQHCNEQIAELQTKVDNTAIADRDRNIAASDQERMRGYIVEAQKSLEFYQKQLSDQQGAPANPY